jgi:4-aminobutyrate aminotransferase
MTNLLQYIPKSLSKLHKNIIPIKAEGSWLAANNQKIYLDLTSGIGVLSTGHNHPVVKNAVKTQLDYYVHTPQIVFGTHPAQIELSNQLNTILPEPLESFFYTNSGTEATDNAIKVARRYTKKTNIISVMGGFHGRGIGAMSLNSSGLLTKMNSQPLMSGVFFTEPTPESLDKTLTLQTHPDETACIILESVQGESGIFSLSPEFVQHVRQVCSDNNILMIADEVQCGMGRTGSWWNIESKGVIPDMMTIGKGIGGGYPMAGVISTDEIMDCGRNYLGGTYGGNAICSVASTATIQVIKDEKLLENCVKMGDRLNEGLKNNPKIKELRQYGLMVAIDIDDSLNILEKLREEGILVLLAGYKGQYIRLLPPLNVKEDEIDFFVNTFNDITSKL